MSSLHKGKILSQGIYRVSDGRAQIEWELVNKDGKITFTASGSHPRGGGQCLDQFLEDYPEDEMVRRIHTVWSRWHLNDMHAGCEHQREMGWGHGHDVALSISEANPVQLKSLQEYALNKLASKREKFIKETLDEWSDSRRKRYEAAQKILGHTLSIHEGNEVDRAVEFLRNPPKQQERPRYQGGRGLTSAEELTLARKMLELVKNNAEAEFPVQLKSEIFENSIGAPCPVCGYRYGSAWVYEPIPEDIIAEIKSWEGNAEDSLENNVAEQFLKRNEIQWSMEKSNTKTLEGVRGHHYVITLTDRDNESLSFDFFGSEADKSESKDPSKGSILECIASDLSTEEKFEDFCSSLGYDSDSRTAERIFNAVQKQKQNFRAFLGAEQYDELVNLFQ